MTTKAPASMTVEGVTAAQITTINNSITSLNTSVSTNTSDISALNTNVTALQAVPLYTAGTAATPTSGTAAAFTGIPATAKRVSIVFSGVGTSSTSVLQVQVGNGSFVATGYNGQMCAFGGALAQSATSTGVTFYNSNASTSRWHGRVTFNKVSGNTWAFDSLIGNSIATNASFAAGSIALGGALDRIQLTTVNGTDTFAAGTVNVTWE